MNTQSMGALLILAGLALLWAIWSERSPFRQTIWGAATPKGAGEPKKEGD